MLYTRSLLVIHFKYSSVYMSIPKSLTTPSTMRVKSVKVKVARSCPALCDPMDYSSWNSPGQNTGVGSLSLLPGIFPAQGSSPDSLPAEPQGKPKNTGEGSVSLLQQIFPTQGSNWGLPHCRQILFQLSHKGSPRILEWVAFPFSSGSLRPRNQTGVSPTLQVGSLPAEL